MDLGSSENVYENANTSRRRMTSNEQDVYEETRMDATSPSTDGVRNRKNENGK